MFDEKGNEEQDSSTDDEEAKPETEEPEVISIDDDDPKTQAQPLTRSQKRRQQEGEGEERVNTNQRPEKQNQVGGSQVQSPRPHRSTLDPMTEPITVSTQGGSPHVVSGRGAVREECMPAKYSACLPRVAGPGLSRNRREKQNQRNTTDGLAISGRGPPEEKQDTEEQPKGQVSHQQNESERVLTFMETIRLSEGQKRRRNEEDGQQLKEVSDKRLCEN